MRATIVFASLMAALFTGLPPAMAESVFREQPLGYWKKKLLGSAKQVFDERAGRPSADGADQASAAL